MKRKKGIFFRGIFFHILGAGMGGWVLASLNVSVELIRGGSIFAFSDILKISIWHIVLCGLAGAFIGLLVASARLVFNKLPKIKSTGVVSTYLLGAVWMFVFGYVNIYYLPGIFSTLALFWNLGMLIAGMLLYAGLFFVLRKKERVRFTLLPRIVVVILLGLTLISGITPIFSKKSTERGTTEQTTPKKYNVVFILLDALRSDHLGCYGYQKETTPNIDKLAEEGVIFDQAYSQSSHTLESVPSYMTSSYPSTHNVRTHTSALPKKLKTLPEVFHSHGYATSIISANPYVSPVYGYYRGVDDFYCIEGNTLKINKTVLGYFLQNAKRISHLFKISSFALNLGKLSYPSQNSLNSGDPGTLTAKAVNWIQDNQNSPFFLYIHYDGAHNPYHSPYGKKFDPDYQKEPVKNFPEGLGMFLPFVKGKSLSQRKRQNMIAQYDGQIFFHDKHLGELFLSLEKLNLKKNTLIVITSDHGEEFYEHQGWGHGQSLHEELLHVPLIFYGTEQIPPGQRISSLVELVDIFPTLLQLYGFEDIDQFANQMEGYSLIPYFNTSEVLPRRTSIFSEVMQGGHWAQCLRTNTHKAVDIHFGREELKLLFNLSKDPGEKLNIFNNEDLLSLNLFKDLKKTADRARKKSFKSRNTTLDEKQKEQLRSLGYIK